MVIADTGFWLALSNRKDRHHALAKRRLRHLQEPLITTWPVVTETCYVLLTRLGSDSQRRFVDSLWAGAFSVFDLRRDHAPRISTLMESYADLRMDLADASLVLLAKELGHGRSSRRMIGTSTPTAGSATSPSRTCCSESSRRSRSSQSSPRRQDSGPGQEPGPRRAPVQRYRRRRRVRDHQSPSLGGEALRRVEEQGYDKIFELIVTSSADDRHLTP